MEEYKMYFGDHSSISTSKAHLLVALCLQQSFPHRPVLKMLSRNLVIASVAVVFLASTVSTAPVEDKEPEENDFEAEEGEEELSEEEEDDDDSKAQHMKGVGSQQATSAPKGSGMSLSPGSSVVVESPNGHKLNGATQTGQVSLSSTSTSSAGSSGGNGRDGYSRPSASSSHYSSSNGQDGSKSDIVPPGAAGAHGGLGFKVPGPDGAVHTVSISVVSSGQGSSGHISASHVIGRPSGGQMSGASGAVSAEVQSQPSGSEVIVEHTEAYENGDSAHEASQTESPEIPETESNGNGHKQLMNGGETGFTGSDHFVPDTSQIQGTGGFDTFGTSPHLDITGVIDQSSHDLLVGLMGGMEENFGPDSQTGGLDHMGLFQVDSTAGGLSPGHQSSGSVLDVPPGSVQPSADNGDTGFSHSISVSDNGKQSSSPADPTDSSLIMDTLAHPGHFFTDYSDNGMDNNGADAPDTNGNGRHKPVVDIQKGTEHQFVSMETHHTAAGTLDLNDHTLSPYTDTTGHDSVTGASAQTDMAGVAGELVTDGNLQTDVTGRDQSAVTDGLPKYTDSVHATGAGFTDASQTHGDVVQTDLQATGDPFSVSSQTDVMGTATAEPQGTLGGPTGHPGATEQTQTAVSAGEQYHTSGQGPEGAENVELEDTC